MKLTDKQKKLLKFVKDCHEGQTRKFSDEPYYHHLLGVAEIANEYEIYLGIELGLCHDIFEDTDCNEKILHSYLKEIGYEHLDSNSICYVTRELTNVFTLKDFPQYKRTWRKNRESERLGTLCNSSQTIKYCDIIHNIKNLSNIIEHDKNFANIYLQEKFEVLDYMRLGNLDLLVKCYNELCSVEKIF